MTKARDTLGPITAESATRPTTRMVFEGRFASPKAVRKVANRALLTCAAFSMIGCGGAARPAGVGDNIERGRAAVVRAEAAAVQSEGETFAATGLEVRWWVVDDAGRDLFRRAAAHGASLDFLSEETREVLADHGFRLLRLPMTHFAPLADDLTISTELSTDWLGQSFRWVGVMSGPRLEEGAVVSIGERRVVLPAGRFELALRTWVVPTGGEPYLHAELLPRYEPARERTLASLAGESQRRRPILETHARLRLERGYVYLLTAEAPAVAWSPETEPLSDASADASSSGVVAERNESIARSAHEERLIGPLTPSTPTVGQLLLQSTTAAGVPGMGRRAVAVLLPHLPSEATLLPPPR